MDANIIGDSLVDAANAARTFEVAAKRIGLITNTEETKITDFIENGQDPNEMEVLNYGNVCNFKY